VARTRSADYDEQRNKILSHAVKGFAQEGYVSASMASLASVCGVSKATLYHYFATKESILFALLDGYTKTLLTLATELERQAFEAGFSDEQTLRHLLRGFMAEYRQRGDYHLVLLMSPRYLDAPQRLQIFTQERAVMEVFSRVLARCFPTVINPTNRVPLTMTLMGSINFTFAWLRDDGPLSHERYGDWVADLWLKGINSGQFLNDERNK
jgi:AcrR family transcriptional regulator